ncbi:MAG: ankyrin repeat domain-containing protein [Burkholderiales bacterium]
MNEKLAVALRGHANKYPLELEKLYPRILEKIANLWDTPEVETCLNDLLVNERDTRQGFPPHIVTELLALYNVYEELHRKTEDTDPWADETTRTQLAGLGIEYSLQGFVKSVENGDKSAVDAFLRSGIDVDIRSENGWTPLMVAAFNGREDIAHALIQRGANIRARDHNGYSPIHWAAFKGYNSVVELLISKGAGVNATNNYGWTPLLQAATRGHKEVVDLLVSKGADPNMADKDGWTPMHKAAGIGYKEIVETLIARKADVNARYKDGTTPLAMALNNDRTEVVQLLVIEGAII